jgi:hypothetical protein
MLTATVPLPASPHRIMRPSCFASMLCPAVQKKINVPGHNNSLLVGSRIRDPSKMCSNIENISLMHHKRCDDAQYYRTNSTQTNSNEILSKTRLCRPPPISVMSQLYVMSQPYLSHIDHKLIVFRVTPSLFLSLDYHL